MGIFADYFHNRLVYCYNLDQCNTKETDLTSNFDTTRQSEKKTVKMNICYRSKSRLLSLALIMILSMGLAGCDNEITMDDLETRYGRAYVKGQRTPFSGAIKQYYDPENEDKDARKVFREGFYVNGLKEDKWITYKWSGAKVETPYVNGRKEGVEKTFYSTGEPKREQRFFDGLPNGNDVHFNRQKEITLQLFYRNGVVGPPPPNRKAELKIAEEEEIAKQKRNERLFGKRQKSWMEHVMDML